VDELRRLAASGSRDAADILTELAEEQTEPADGQDDDNV
jgi:hypothetical protein